MYQPLIGVSGSVDKEATQSFILRCYMQSLIEAGALPLLLSPDMAEEQILQCADVLDGLLLAGGNDVDPGLYGEQLNPALGEVNPIRDRLEMHLIPAFLQKDKPVFGICRGIQILNVALGGTLYQDLPSQYSAEKERSLENHSQQPPYSASVHTVRVMRESKLFSLVQADSLSVNSMHHQAIKDAAAQLVTCAVSSDGVIEAVEMPEKSFVIGVQWHPERLGDNSSKRLFRKFIEAAVEKHC